MTNTKKLLAVLFLLVLASSFATAVTSDSSARVTADANASDALSVRTSAAAKASVDQNDTNARVTARNAIATRKAFVFNNRSLQCGDEAMTSRERVLCRLRLRNYKNELNYVPEECRTLNGTAQERCFDVYDRFQQCRGLAIGLRRDACLREKIGLTVNVSRMREAKQQCETAENKSACLEELRGKAFLFARAKLYDLQEKAQRWQTVRGVDEEAVADFVALIDQRKIEFSSAATIAAKIAVLQQAQRDYVAFVHSVNGSTRVTANATVESTENN
ncbi:MAG: hypothetical protein Q7K43_03470 [Candidatus Woesearchaeota archaeon]|nr:hypothetical protein [Candidatus Woesearchaeota archaeon]